jgi:acetyl esterase
MCRAICEGSASAVLSVGYRLAPEHAFPTAVDDCLAALRWAGMHADLLNADVRRLSVAGDSAGGNLAAATALRARDEGGPSLLGQVLIYPVVDAPNAARSSYVAYGRGMGLTTEMMQFFWSMYVRDAALHHHPHAAPLRASSFANLPRTLLVSPEFDVLRDECEEFADRLRADGTSVDIFRAEGMNHGFLSWPDRIDGANQAMEVVCAWLRDLNGVTE